MNAAEVSTGSTGEGSRRDELLRIAARLNRISLLPIRFAQLVAQTLFVRKLINHIDKPPEVNPSRPQVKTDPAQLLFSYA